MSNQPQRVRRNGSPSTSKQGPIKAVKAFSLKQGHSHLTSTSPRDSSKLWSTKSVDANSPDRLSPGGTANVSSQVSLHSQSQSPNHLSNNGANKEKSKNLRHSPVPGKSTRASSVDAVVPTYLTGHWPKDINNYHHCQTEGVFMCDKSTQTVSDIEKTEKRRKTHKRSASLGQGDHLKLQFIKQHLQKSKEGSKQFDGKQRTSPIPGKHSALSFTAPPALCTQLCKAVTHLGPVSRPNMNRFQRNSVEGLNTEIEKLVSSVKSVSLSSSDGDDNVFREIPDGHRAPAPELNRLSCTRSVDTQTPLEQLDVALPASHLLPYSPVTPTRPKSVDNYSILRSRSNSIDSKSSKENSPEPSPYVVSPKLETSCPFVREPPDGCEKITVVDESRRPLIKEPMLFSPVKPNQFVFKPSQGSAFCPLIKSYLVD
ncbi:protein FAM117B [Biomphalaria glabrata]|uniref:Protein FAM117B-like n=1 Tax=Biomphalaria glabrata TaxID=6526 RepID=A0A9W2ZJI6_BIOGL|nr:protein FAM117B-like [Biomphalaria glabrata]XP_055875108.1 protein FAM117B-like [Biomphalaria glabrata]KAI8756043.1 FAM117B protein [Biomphalaria glabrata]